MKCMISDHLVQVNGPFVIVIEPGKDGWTAKIIGGTSGRMAGPGFDQVTMGKTPAEAAAMAADVVKMLTGECKIGDPTPHDWSIDSSIEIMGKKACDAWECSRCGERANKETIVDYDDTFDT